MWDLRSTLCQVCVLCHPITESHQAKLTSEGGPCFVAFNSEGTMFAAAAGKASNIIKLYDMKQLSKVTRYFFTLVTPQGPLNNFVVPSAIDPSTYFTGVHYSNDGKFLLVTTNSKYSYLFDVAKGEMVWKLFWYPVLIPSFLAQKIQSKQWPPKFAWRNLQCWFPLCLFGVRGWVHTCLGHKHRSHFITTCTVHCYY